MRTHKLEFFLFFCLMFMVAGCAPQSEEVTLGDATAESTKSTASESQSNPTSPASGLELSLEALMDQNIYAPSIGQPVSLKDGDFVFTNGMRVYFLPQAAFGDLNNDQMADAVVLLAEKNVLHEVLVSLIVLIQENGEFNQKADLLIGKDAEIYSITIDHAEITLNALLRNTGEDMDLPERNVWQTYQYWGETLVLTKVSSSINQGTLRTIEISSPVDGDQVGASVFLKGGMPVSPFENNLRFTVFDMEGQLLTQSGFMVDAEEMGTPAVFSNKVDLPPLPSGTRVRLELADLSMADGSLIAMDSVWVTIK